MTRTTDYSPTAARTWALLGSTALTGLLAGLLGANPVQAQQTIDNGETVTVPSGPQPSPWIIADTLRVGDTGAGTLVIEGGGQVSSLGGEIGNEQGASGIVSVDDFSSRWDVAGDLLAGVFGRGELNITDGGIVFADSLNIGAYLGSTGIVTLEDAQLISYGDITVGSAGDGTLIIRNDSHVYGDLPLASPDPMVPTAVNPTADAYIANTSFAKGAVTVDNATWDQIDQLNVGYGGDGSLTIENGGTVRSLQGIVAGLVDAKGTVTVNGAGSSWTADQFILGGYGAAIVDITNGGRMSAANGVAYIASSSGSEATVTIDGAGSLLESSGGMSVGLDGNGTLNIRNGGSAASGGTVNIGSRSTATGAVTVDGENSRLTIGDNLRVGVAGKGTLTISDKGSVSSVSNAEIGHDSGAVGAVTVTGAGSTLQHGTTTLYVGYQGSGSLTVADGASVTGGRAVIGLSAGSDGTVVVTGADAAWSNDDDLTIGSSGTGTLTIADGGSVSDDNGSAGANAGSTGTVTVEGAGSRWMNDGQVSVGYHGTGTVTVRNGGGVSSTSGLIGAAADGTGTVAVEGAGSLWANDDGLAVGALGDGRLTIADGGRVRTRSVTIAQTSGSTGALYLNGTAAARGVLEAGGVSGGGGTAALSFDGGILRATQSNNDFLIGFAPGEVTIEAGGAFVDSGGYDLATATELRGSGGLTKQGAGSLTLLGANNYAGGTVIEGGTLALAADGTLGAPSGALFIADGATLDLGGVMQTVVGALSGAGTIVNSEPATSSLGVDQATDTVFSGTIADSAHGVILRKSGAGTLTLTGDSDFRAAGVSGGTLAVDGLIAAVTDVQNGGTLTGKGAIAGFVEVQDGGTLAGVAGQTLTMSRLVLDAGALVDITLGAPSTSGLFAVTGDLTLNGTLNVTGQAGFGEGLYRLFDYGGTLGGTGLAVGAVPTGYTAGDLDVVTAVDHQVNLMVGPVTGAGPFVLWDGANMTANSAVDGGSGTWSLAGTNWTNADGDGNGPYDSSAMLVFAGPAGTVQVDAAGAGSLAVSAGGVQFFTDGYVVQGDALSLGTGTTRIRVGDGTSAGITATIASAIGGVGGLEKDDLGTLVLTGLNTYAGGTTVSAGTLAVNGSLNNSVVTVLSDARLGGNGTIGGLVVASGATVAPGNSIGTLNVAGNVMFAAGSVYEVETSAAGQADRIAATGTATIRGGKVDVLAGSGNYAPATSYSILTADGGVTGRFESVGSNLAFLTPSLGYGATEITLTLTRNDMSFAGIGNTPNQRAAGAGVESLGLGNAIWDAAVQLDADTARAAFDRLSGEIHASARTALIEDSRFAREAALERMRTPIAQGGAVWGRVFGSWNHIDSDGNAAKLGRSAGGFFVGVDGQLSEGVRLGVLAGYGHTHFDATARASSGDSDNYHLGAYADGRWGPMAVRVGLAHAWHSLDMIRTIVFPGVSDRVTSSYKARTSQAFAEVGYAVSTGATTFEPFAGLAYVDLRMRGFTEKGGEAALTARSRGIDTVFSTLGVRGSAILGRDGLKAVASLGWRHAFGDVIPRSIMTFAGGGDAFTVTGVPIARNIAVIDAGLDVPLGDNADFGLSYNGQFGSGLVDNGVRANLRLRF